MAHYDVDSIRVQAAFYYEVEIDGAVISFQECSGLTIKNELIEYRNSDDVDFTKKARIGLTTISDLTLSKGQFEGDSFVTDLFNRTWEKAYMSHTDQNFDVSVRLLDETGAVVNQWNFTDCVVVSLEGATLKSDDNSAAIEKLVLRPNGVKAEW